MPSDQANELVIGLSRILIPVNYTRSGPFDQDLALRADPLPGLAIVAELANLSPGDDRYYYVQTQLLRERNRVDAALRAAQKLVTGQ
jgi:hypothetical protein